VDADGLPNVRMVLLKDIEDDAFVFYTNFESAKGQELAARGKAAFVAHWKSLRRQLRVRGPVTRVEDATADAYYRSRALQSRLGAWASRQSRPLASREALMAEVARITVRRAPTRRVRRSGAGSGSARRDRVLGRRRLPAARPVPLDPCHGGGGAMDCRPAQSMRIVALSHGWKRALFGLAPRPEFER
jgi:hypothetical protein